MQSTMQTSQKPISPHGGGESTFFQEGSLANLSALPDNERERAMTVTSGLKCYGLYGRYSPLGSLARTLLASSRWYSPARRLKWEAKPLCSERLTEREHCCGRNTLPKPSAVTLNVRDIPSGRLLFRLVPSEHPTAGTGCGLSQGVLLPTPAVMEDRRKPNGNPVRQKKIMSNLNPYSIRELLPTVQTQGLKICNGQGKTAFMPLELLPTPTASCHNAGTTKDRKDGIPRTSELNHLVAHQTGKSSQLNPLFVAEMMGFPVDWTVSPFQSGGRNPSKPTETR